MTNETIKARSLTLPGKLEWEKEFSSLDELRNYAFDDPHCYGFAVNAMHETRTADENGLDTTYFSNGAISSIRLNEVNDESQAIHFGLSYTW